MAYQITRKSELVDQLVFMAAMLPEPSADARELLPKLSIETEFAALEAGFVSVRPKLGQDKLKECRNLAARARQAYADNQDEWAYDCLYVIVGLLQGKQYRRMADPKGGH